MKPQCLCAPCVFPLHFIFKDVFFTGVFLDLESAQSALLARTGSGNTTEAIRRRKLVVRNLFRGASTQLGFWTQIGHPDTGVVSSVTVDTRLQRSGAGVGDNRPIRRRVDEEGDGIELSSGASLVFGKGLRRRDGPG
jgi:hypothetical protein